MEKISNIIRGSARVASVDMKKEAPVRPGVPTFGRPVGESPHVNEWSESTASKAVALQNEMDEAKRNARDHATEKMSEQFFNNRIRTATDEPASSGGGKSSRAASFEVEEEPHGLEHEAESVQPSGFTPRGSFVNVHA